VQDRNLPQVNRNPHFAGLRCVVCGRGYGPEHPSFVCSHCGVDGILDVEYDLSGLKKELARVGARRFFSAAGGIWRFAPLLPVLPTAPHPAWNLAGTPLHPAPALAGRLGLGELWLKDDTGLPSGSLKDRAAALGLAHARHLGREVLACASTGNAAASLAVLGARAGVECHIFVPAAAPQAKLAQLLVHGAKVRRVAGTYDQAFNLSLREIENNGWYSRNCAHNPILVEGKKTAILETMLMLGQGFQSGPASYPDAIFVPVGDGCIVSSVAKGLSELHELGLIPTLPRVIGVQAQGAAPLATAWAACPDPAQLDGQGILRAIQPMVPSTVADSISVGIPRNRVKAWRGVAATGGQFLGVTDDEIKEAILLLARSAGVFAEPSGAAGLAGVRKALAQGVLDHKERVLVLVTGHGLKDPQAALGGIDLPEPITPRS
jgi:threonine synthase